MLKKTFAVLGTLALAFTLASCGGKQLSDKELMEQGWVKDPANNGWVEAPKALPAPQDTSKEYKDKIKQEDGTMKDVVIKCTVGNYNLNCSTINHKNLGSYMNRADVAYIDLRGPQTGYDNGHIRGFESVDYFQAIVGAEKQLFDKDYNARYQESKSIVEKIFPKDKSIFLMCQSGGRVVNMMKLLEKLGYDMTKVYNVGGENQLGAADSTVKDLYVKTGMGMTPVTYDFSKLTPVK